jgi:probable phosphoglycerate mutase
LLLIRHGQSAPYVSGQPFDLVDGHGDPHLTDLGHQQAQWLADRLASEPIDAIYVSSLSRTHQTAAPLAERLDLTPRVEPDLREVFLGQFEGGLLRELSADGDPLVRQMKQQGEWSVVPGAETNEAFTARTVGAVTGIAQAHPDELVAVVCHGGVIGAVLGWALGIGARDLVGARHTSVSHLWVGQPVDDPASWTLRLYNDGGHAGMLTTDHQLAD